MNYIPGKGYETEALPTDLTKTPGRPAKQTFKVGRRTLPDADPLGVTDALAELLNQGYAIVAVTYKPPVPAIGAYYVIFYTEHSARVAPPRRKS